MSTSPLPTEPAGATAASPLQGCYLTCLDQPYFHARHYVGYSDDIARRLVTHRKGQGTPLLAAALAAGIDFRVVRTWPGADRQPPSSRRWRCAGRPGTPPATLPS